MKDVTSISLADVKRLKKVDKHRRSYLAHKKWVAKNKEKKRASEKRWKERNVERCREYRRNTRYKRRAIIGSHTRIQWESLKEKFNHCCAICGMQEPFTKQYLTFLTEDHIIPICAGGTNDISNIQPLCQSCNSSKGRKAK